MLPTAGVVPVATTGGLAAVSPVIATAAPGVCNDESNGVNPFETNVS